MSENLKKILTEKYFVDDHTEKLINYFLEEIARKYKVSIGLYIVNKATKFPTESEKFFSPLCSSLKNNKRYNKLCEDDHCKRAMNEKHPVVDLCHCGLYNFSYPIFVEDTHVGTILCGQKLINNKISEDESICKFNEFIINNNLECEKDLYISLRNSSDCVDNDFFVKIERELNKVTSLIMDIFIEKKQIENERNLLKRNLLLIAHEILIYTQGAVAAASELQYEISNKYFDNIINISSHMEGSLQHITTVVANLIWAETKMTYKFAKNDALYILRASVKHYKWFASSKEIEIKLKIGDGSPNIICSEHHIKQLVNNLLHNAIKYSYKGNYDFGRYRYVDVKFSLIRNYNCICFEFVNYGIGILEDEYDKIMEKEVRGVLVADENRSGTGLGLRIVARIVKRHNGFMAVYIKKLMKTHIKIHLKCLYLLIIRAVN